MANDIKQLNEAYLRLSEEDRAKRTCAWRVGEDFVACGKPVEPGKQYCATHEKSAEKNIADEEKWLRRQRFEEAKDSKDKIVYKLKRKVETDEWMVAAYVNGKFNDDKTYYTDDKEDAEQTLKHMQKSLQ